MFEIGAIIAIVILCTFMLFHYRLDAIGSIRQDTSIKRCKGFLPVVGTLFVNCLRIDDYFMEIFTGDKAEKAVLFGIPFVRSIVVIGDYESIEYILKDQFENYQKGGLYKIFFKDIIRDSILASTGTWWYRQRKCVVGALSAKSLEASLNTTFAEKISSFITNLESKTGQEVDLWTAFNSLFLEAFSKVGFGFDLDCKGDDQRFGLALSHTIDAIGKRFSENIFFLITERFDKKLQEDFKFVRSFSLELIRKRRASNQKYDDLMQHLMDHEDSLTDDQLVDHIISLLLAGRDTTSGTICWALYELLKNPGTIDRILAEAKEVMGGGIVPTFRDVKKMKYANAVFRETLRMHPPVPKSGRQALKDDILPNGTRIRKGTMVGYSMYTVGYSNQFKDPFKFNPDRWLDPETRKLPILAFSAGPRVCVGERIGEVQGVCALVAFLQSFEIVECNLDSIQRTYGITLGMTNGFKCQVLPRN